MVNFHELKDIACDVVVACSVGHTLLPPWDAEALKPYPRVQAGYRLFIYIVGYIAINARSTIYPSISINNPNGVNVTKVSGV